MVKPRTYTPDMVRELPDDGVRYETVNGELLVSPAPAFQHQRVVRELLRALADYCDATGVGEALTSPADISLNPDSLVQPDVFVLRPGIGPGEPWSGVGRPLLVAEVLSPSSNRADRFVKRTHYQQSGIPIYWMVDTDERLVEVWTPDAPLPVVERADLVWDPAGASELLRLPLDRLFR